MSEPSVVPQVKKKSGWLSWSTRDILIMAAIGVVFGIIIAALTYLYALTTVFGAIVAWAWFGIYILPGFFIAYVLRRGGSAFLIAIIYGLVMIPISPYGPSMMLNALFYAITGEVGIAIGTRYRHYGLLPMIISGALSGIVLLVIYLILYPESYNLALPLLIGVIAATIVSSAISAIIAKYLADAVARTGVLSGTALKSKEVEEI